MIILQNWNIFNELISIDPKTGIIEVLRKSNNTEYNLKGYASFIDEECAAVYFDNGSLYFQINNNRWDLGDPEISLKYSRFLNTETICVKRNKDTIFKRKIKLAKNIINHLLEDPTFDGIDEDNEYFLSWLSRSSKKNEWISNMISKYSKT